MVSAVGQAGRRGCGRKRATRAAPDCARVRTPERALYHCGVAPVFRRQFFFGCRYSGKIVMPGRSPDDVDESDEEPVASDHDFSKSVAPV
jgi:hypothetical protein